jgi:DNA-binding NtrC family response regulator
MPANVVVVHDDPELMQEYTGALKAAAHEVQGFSNPLIALTALEAAHTIKLLITVSDFGPGKLNGVALARMARLKKPGVAVLFLGAPEEKPHTKGLGEFLEAPASVESVLEAANRLLSSGLNRAD